MYTPFRSEEELEKCVADAAKDGYTLFNQQIQAVKSQVMEHLESTEEARFVIEKLSIMILMLVPFLIQPGSKKMMTVN